LLVYALIFLTVALLAGALGFWAVAGMAAVVFKFLLVACLILLVASVAGRNAG
jgi:uncharacterized membrane protein YtjA (UPF0391 family)